MTTTRHTISATRSGSYNGMDWDADYQITFTYRPGVREPDELVFVDVEPHEDYPPAQADLVAWAKNWLDENLDRAIDKATR